MSNRYLHVKLIDHVLVRPFAPDDGLAISELLYQSYGYSYRGGAGIYDPDAFAEQVRSGTTQGYVAITPSGRAVGVIARRFVRPDEIEVYELAVDPTFRGKRLSHRLSQAIHDFASEHGVRKVLMTAVTRHEAAQRAMHAFSVLPCAIQPGAHPPALGFRGGDAAESLVRETFVLGCLYLNRRRLAVFLPREVRALARLVYRTHDLPRDERRFPDDPEDLPPNSEITFDLKPDWLACNVRVESIGRDLVSRLEAVLQDLRQGFIEYVELRLPLDTPATAMVLEAIVGAGLFVTGIEPDVSGRDELCLAWVAPQRIAFERAHFVHPTTKALAAFALRQAPRLTSETDAGVRDDRREWRHRAPGRRRRNGLPKVRPAPGDMGAWSSHAGRTQRQPPPESLLQGRLQAVRQLAAGLSHEINNPLNIIQGSAYALKARLKAAPTQGDGALLAQIATIESEVQRVAQLLRRLQRFADPGEVSGTVELGEVLTESSALLCGLARSRDVRIERDSADPLQIPGSLPDLEQAVIQVLLNAIEASRPGQAVRLSVKRTDDEGRIVIVDQGRGISQRELPRVVEPFYTTKQAGQGVGLGLAIACGVLEQHRGYLHIESTPGAGTRVELRLPLRSTETSFASDHDCPTAHEPNEAS